MSDEPFTNTDEAIVFLHDIGSREQEAGEVLERRIDELESALASERAKRGEAEREREVYKGQRDASEVAFNRATDRALAAEAVIEQVRAVDMAQPSRDTIDAILATADLSALREHDAKVWDEGFNLGEDRAYWMTFDGREGLEPSVVNPYRTTP